MYEYVFAFCDIRIPSSVGILILFCCSVDSAPVWWLPFASPPLHPDPQDVAGFYGDERDVQ